MQEIGLNHILHSLLGCGRLEEMIRLAGDRMRNPLILGDLSLHVLGITRDDDIDDPRWRSLYEERMMPLNLVNIALYRTALETEAPVITTDGTGLPIVRCAVAQERKIIGYLLSPCYHGAPSQEELDLMQLLADLCSLRMQKDLHYAEYPDDMMEYFISDLLNGAITDEQQIRDRCSYFGWRLQPPYRLLTVRGQDPGEMERGAGYLEQTRRCEMLRSEFPDATVFLYGEQIKFIVGMQDESVREQLILHQIGEFMERHGLAAGVSQPGRNFRSLAARHRQAMKAIQLGALLKGSGPLYFYDSYAVYHALEMCSGSIDLRELCHAAVLKLERYDRKNGTAYMGTLHAYLASGQNISEAAEALYIHRNTLAKRLEKMNDMITVDLGDRETVFHLLFSLRVIEYYGATQMRSTYEDWLKKMPTLQHT